jgi:predicted PurR-regulated permease PerM
MLYSYLHHSYKRVTERKKNLESLFCFILFCFVLVWFGFCSAKDQTHGLTHVSKWSITELYCSLPLFKWTNIIPALKLYNQIKWIQRVQMSSTLSLVKIQIVIISVGHFFTNYSYSQLLVLVFSYVPDVSKFETQKYFCSFQRKFCFLNV